MDDISEYMRRTDERLAKHGEQIDQLRINREHDSVLLANTNALCLEIKGKLDELEGRPGKRWNSVVSNVVAAVTMAVCAYVLARVGLG